MNIKKAYTLLMAACLIPAVADGAGVIELRNWKMSDGKGNTWDAEVPCTVAGVLADSGYFGEGILEKDNYTAIDKSVFDGAWTFSTVFDAGSRCGNCSLLKFEGLNYYADIVLNGKKIADSSTTFGVFVRRTFNVTKLLKKSGNTLSVTLRRAGKGDLNIGFVDWNPRPADESMGITGTVTLETVGAVAVEDAFVKPLLDVKTLASADLVVEGRLSNLSTKAVKGTLRISYEGGEASIPMTLPAGDTEFSIDASQAPVLHVMNPRIWWTHDLGTPELYNMTISFETGKAVSDSRKVRFGIRSITSEVTEDNSRQFYLNGRRILVKGAGWTDEIFLRDTHESNRLQAEYVKDMNMNCIRFENIWGKDDNIYDLCDSLGLMAMVGWSCQWEWEDYCGRPEYKRYGCINDGPSMDLAVRYFHDQVLRLRNHPSIICWLTGSDCIPNPELEKRYLEIYNRYDYRPYVCSAKALVSEYGGHSGTKMAGPYEYVGPDYWYLDTQNGGAFGFNTETGIGLNIPQMPSLVRMLSEENMSELGKVWDYHCTASSSAMNSTKVLTEVMDASYGRPTTMEDFVNRAHAIDYDATRAMFEAFRCNIPVSTGIIQWMLNSAWPSLYWQLYDYYKVPTASYYGTKKACEPLQLIYNYKERAVFGVNESGAKKSVRVVAKAYDAATGATTVMEWGGPLMDNSSLRLFEVPAGNLFLSLSLYDKDGGFLTDNFYCVPAECNVYDWEHTNWYMTPISGYADMSFVSQLPKACVKMTVSTEGNIYTVTLENTSKAVSYQNILRMTGSDGNLIVPAFWSDNFISLLPSEVKTVTCTVPEGKEGHVDVQTWNTVIEL